VLVDVAAEADVIEGTPHVLRLNGREVLLVRWRKEVFAVRNICPHQSLPIAIGRVHSALHADKPAGVVDVLDEEPLIQCPVHAWNYELRSGKCTVDPRLRIKTYPVTVKQGRILIEDRLHGETDDLEPAD